MAIYDTNILDIEGRKKDGTIELVIISLGSIFFLKYSNFYYKKCELKRNVKT